MADATKKDLPPDTITLTPSSSVHNESNSKISQEIQLNPNRYQVRSGNMLVRTLAFTNLLNYVTKLDKGNFLICQNTDACRKKIQA